MRVSKTTGASTMDYLVDLASTLPLVISDTDAVYLYGLDIIAEQLAGADRYYYVHDGLGSARQLLDTTAQIATRYAYDPFGVPLAGNGVPNPWQFTGEAWDAGVELLYLRARYYQPETGRFVTKDPWRGDVQQPPTLNRYVYVQNNGVNYADLSGLDGGGPGGLSTGIEPGPAPPEYLEVALMLIPIPPYDPVRILLLPYYGFWEMFLYLQTGHSPMAAGNLSKIILSSWALQFGPEDQWFGPEHSLTQEVMRSPALARFRTEWGKPEPEGGRYRLPWTWIGDRIEDTLDLGTYDNTNYEIVAHNLIMLAAMSGYGSWDPGGGINTLGGVFGSFDEIRVQHSRATRRMVKMTAMNSMDKCSLTRPIGGGPEECRWPPEERSRTFWGGTIRQHFYWEEPMPQRCELRMVLDVLEYEYYKERMDREDWPYYLLGK
ncbi:MAG: hypothetical protein GTO63_00735 [Anaerolineae bacterium]|nr:hypothetical protein [Anaerolineae bacterium]NIN93534.1 hypothetical protein [Anaerolineae bacterium]